MQKWSSWALRSHRFVAAFYPSNTKDPNKDGPLLPFAYRPGCCRSQSAFLTFAALARSFRRERLDFSDKSATQELTKVFKFRPSLLVKRVFWLPPNKGPFRMSRVFPKTRYWVSLERCSGPGPQNPIGLLKMQERLITCGVDACDVAFCRIEPPFDTRHARHSQVNGCIS